MRTCTQGNWGVSTTTGTGIKGAILHVYRILANGKIAKGELYGKQYPSNDAAFAAALEHGYLKPYYKKIA